MPYFTFLIPGHLCGVSANDPVDALEQAVIWQGEVHRTLIFQSLCPARPRQFSHEEERMLKEGRLIKVNEG